jgi:hypothetical protein
LPFLGRVSTRISTPMTLLDCHRVLDTTRQSSRHWIFLSRSDLEGRKQLNPLSIMES